MTVTAGKRGDERKSCVDFWWLIWPFHLETRKEAYAKLLSFVDTNNRFGVDRLYGLLSSTGNTLSDLRWLIKAESSVQISMKQEPSFLGDWGGMTKLLSCMSTVYTITWKRNSESINSSSLTLLKPVTRYCKRVYQPGTESSGVFLTLCRIYLRPTVETSADLLQPALDLISRHNPRLDPVETLQLLPPLVTTQDVKAFLIESVRAPIFDTKVVSQISKARKDQVSRKLMVLQSKRVKVTDSRMWVGIV